MYYMYVESYSVLSYLLLCTKYVVLYQNIVQVYRYIVYIQGPDRINDVPALRTVQFITWPLVLGTNIEHIV